MGPRGNTIKAKVTRAGDKITADGSGGNASMTLEIVGGNLVETLSGKGLTFTRTHSK